MWSRSPGKHVHSWMSGCMYVWTRTAFDALSIHVHDIYVRSCVKSQSTRFTLRRYSGFPIKAVVFDPETTGQLRP